MAKKSFTDKNPALQYLTPEQPQEHIEGAQHTHDTPSTPKPPNAHREDSTPGTPGPHAEKGRRLPRINVAMPAERIKYLQLVSRLDGVTTTEYINQLVLADQANRAGELERARQILKGAE